MDNQWIYNICSIKKETKSSNIAGSSPSYMYIYYIYRSLFSVGFLVCSIIIALWNCWEGHWFEGTDHSTKSDCTPFKQGMGIYTYNIMMNYEFLYRHMLIYSYPHEFLAPQSFRFRATLPLPIAWKNWMMQFTKTNKMSSSPCAISRATEKNRRPDC